VLRQKGITVETLIGSARIVSIIHTIGTVLHLEHRFMEPVVQA
jgi:hypothetical protein